MGEGGQPGFRTRSIEENRGEDRTGQVILLPLNIPSHSSTFPTLPLEKSLDGLPLLRIASRQRSRRPKRAHGLQEAGVVYDVLARVDTCKNRSTSFSVPRKGPCSSSFSDATAAANSPASAIAQDFSLLNIYPAI